jgi:hypothetical protein
VPVILPGIMCYKGFFNITYKVVMQNRPGIFSRSCKRLFLFCMFFVLISLSLSNFQISAAATSDRIQNTEDLAREAGDQEAGIADQDPETEGQDPAIEEDVAETEEPVTETEADAETGNDIAVTQEDESVVRPVTSDDIKRGERLFRGLLPLGTDAASCASCHYTGISDTFNWNPSAYEISLANRERDVAALRSVVMSPVTTKMMEVHEGYDISDGDFFQIKAFMDSYAADEITERPVITNTLIFIGLLVIFMGALADLTIFKKIPFKLVHLVIILGSGFFIVDMIAYEAIALGRSQYYEPDQPIKFSHAVHVNDNQTECLYCHNTAEYSKSAGIPSAAQCMNCHIIVREGTNSGRFEINKLVAAYDNEMPVRWVRVYNLPDHAHFSHAQHVGVAGLDCAECHGEVEQMDRVVQVNDLSMGWCLDCHRTNEVDIFANEFYSDYMLLRDDLREGRIDLVTAREIGGTDCMKCHY